MEGKWLKTKLEQFKQKLGKEKMNKWLMERRKELLKNKKVQSESLYKIY